MFSNILIIHTLTVFALIFSRPCFAVNRPLVILAEGVELRIEEQAEARLSQGKLTSLQLSFLKPQTQLKLACNLLYFSAWMPEHRHGMLTKLRWKKLEDIGVWQVEGVKLHMTGLWEFVIKAECAAKNISFTTKLTL